MAGRFFRPSLAEKKAMRKRLLYLLAICLPGAIMAQAKKDGNKIPLTAEHWNFAPTTTEFGDYKGQQALRVVKNGVGATVLKDLQFSNGAIEFDMIPEDSFFACFYFHWQDKMESETFYLRTQGGDKPGALWPIQYTSIIKGVNMWDMYPQYQGPAAFKKTEWNHIRLVMNGLQMRAYINDMQHPVMEVPRLEGNTTTGTIAFEGKLAIANLVVKPNDTEGLLPQAGLDPTSFDPRYLRHWAISGPVPLPFGSELYERNLPAKETVWDTISAERQGLINLSRRFGFSGKDRRAVWLKVKLHTAIDQQRRVSLGFSDEVWIFLNGREAFADKNLFGAPGMKAPEGRCAVDNTSFNLPLKAGDNELLIGVSNDFYGWGIIARLDNMEGITVVP